MESKQLCKKCWHASGSLDNFLFCFTYPINHKQCSVSLVEPKDYLSLQTGLFLRLV